jgi:hypothetical protein
MARLCLHRRACTSAGGVYAPGEVLMWWILLSCTGGRGVARAPIPAAAPQEVALSSPWPAERGPEWLGLEWQPPAYPDGVDLLLVPHPEFEIVEYTVIVLENRRGDDDEYVEIEFEEGPFFQPELMWHYVVSRPLDGTVISMQATVRATDPKGELTQRASSVFLYADDQGLAHTIPKDDGYRWVRKYGKEAFPDWPYLQSPLGLPGAEFALMYERDFSESQEAPR